VRRAVAHGQLPPEIRSEHAALFNDPESGYDIVIDSDTLGMGLNLHVYLFRRRVVQKCCDVVVVHRSSTEL
jgi:hypothetical protein